jgi:hypothetical protein
MLNFDTKYINESLIENGKTIFFTITNVGYIDYTINMLKSLNNFNIDKKLLIVCLDSNSNTYFKENGYYTYLINLELKEFTSFGEDIFSKFCYIKILVIQKILEMNYNVFYTDGDIYYCKNPIDEINLIKDINGDMWIQNDTIFENNFDNVCAGFMYIRTNSKTKQYFNINTPNCILQYNECAKNNNDQTYLNKYVIPYLNVHLFPLNKFPNGNYFYNFENKIKDSIVMVHFNWVVGHEKKERMKKYNMWLV